MKEQVIISKKNSSSLFQLILFKILKMIAIKKIPIKGKRSMKATIVLFNRLFIFKFNLINNIQIIIVAIDANVPDAIGNNPIYEIVTTDLDSDFILLFVD